MAPALNEPMSPTEKLSNSSAEATAPPIRSMKSVSDTESTSPSAITNSSNTIDIKEKRSRSSSITALPASSSAINPRCVTRSKDAYQRVFEQTVSPTNSLQTSIKEGADILATTKNTLSKADSPGDRENEVLNQTHIDTTKSNDLMGLSMILDNNEHRSDGKNITGNVSADTEANQPISKGSSSNINNNNNTNISCKSNSTEQLLADLTNDIEEAITTKVCIRKEHSGDETAPSERERDIVNLKTVKSGTRESAVTTVSIYKEDSNVENPQSFEEDYEYESERNDNVLDSKPQAQKATTSNDKKELREEDKVTNKDAPTSTTSDSTSSTLTETSNVGHVVARKTEASTRLQILSVDVLPPISTDSTMTASEVEDNIEERLSQLDGTAVSSPVCDDVTSLNAGVEIGIIQTTPPCTFPKQQTHQQQVKQLQQQLQQTPPTSLSQHAPQQQQQHTFTPQSTSSVNTLSSANLPPAFMKESGAGELEDQDIEEVLKVLKGFDGSAGADTLCDLNVLFNEEYTLINYEEVSSQPASTTTTKPNPLKEMQIEIERNQQTMHRRIDFLLRRMRKVQSRYMSKHCSEEIAGLFEWTARIYANKGGNLNSASNLLQADTAISVIAARPPASNWAEEKNPVSSTQMSSMLRRLEQSSNAQQLHTISMTNNLSTVNTQLPRKSKKALLQEMQESASTSTAMSPQLERKGEVVVSNYDTNVSEEMSQVAGLLQTEMRELQLAMDSDATESSSGGESADEMVTYNNQIQQPLAIAKRAAWRYSRDRAAIAARWSWLLSQIADLEIKIRQQTELRQEIVRTKGAVVSGIEEQATHGSPLKSIESNPVTATSSVNGYKGNLGNSCSKIDSIETNETGLLGSARTRGFVPSLFRKRKLLQTQSLHTISKKAARPSNIKCGCQWPFNPCALCTGRIDPTAPRDTPDTMMMADRIALLDPGYHPVLSFREDVSSTLHLECIARMPEWQQRVMRCQVKSIAKSVWKAERAAERAAGHIASKKYSEPAAKRRYIKKKDRLAAEERNAAAAAASATATNSSIASTSIADHTADSTTNLAAVAGEVGGVLADVSAPSACATITSLQACDSANGTGIILSTSSTTPLVANKSARHTKKLHHHYHLVGDGVLLEPPRDLSPVATNHSSHSQSSHHSQQSGNSNTTYIHQTSDNHPQNYDQYNLNSIHSSLISNNSNGFSGSCGGVGNGGVSSGIGNYKNSSKYRKGLTSNTPAGINSSNPNSSSKNLYNISHTYQNNSLTSNYNSEPIDTNWNGFGTRSRTSSPTHTNICGASSSTYYKYESRSKNRTSYDIDNIVIPYSVAAATRVEILPYKEIPTPKWRVIDEDRGDVLQTSLDPTKDMGESLENIVAADNEKSKLVVHENFPDTILPLSDNKLVKENKATNAENPELKVIVKRAEKHNSIQELNKSSASEDHKATISKDELTKNDPLPLHYPQITDQINNMFKNDDSSLLQNESSNIRADHLISKVDLWSEEPYDKRAKIETFIGRKDFEIDIPMVTENCEFKKEHLSDVTAVTTKNFKPKAMVNYRRGIRLKRIKGKSMEMEAAAEEAEIEDITDDAITFRHERKLTEERRKFKTYLKFPWSTRSRANRRIDSRAESSGANTPDPTSPAPQTPSIGGGDQESIPSPLAPSTPLNPLDTVSDVGDNGLCNPPPQNLERRRTTSTKREREMERRSLTPDLKEAVPPYEPLKFPLSDEAFEGLLKAMPVEFHCLNFDSKYLEDCSTTGNAIGGTKIVRQRINCRSDGFVASSRRGKIASIIQHCDVIYNKKQRVNNSRRGGNTAGRGRRRGNFSRSRVKTNNGLPNGDAGAINNRVGVDNNSGGVDDDSDDDEVDLLTLLAQEDDDYDYPKHHLAPDDDCFDGGSGIGGTVNGNSRNGLMDIDDEYDAYLGRQHRDSDANTTDSEPFADDDPNDPEWCGDSEDRGGGGTGSVFGSEKYRRSLR